MKKQLQIRLRSHWLSMIILFMLVTSSLDTAAQIHLVRDFETTPDAGATAGSPSATVGRNHFFMGRTNLNGQELWKTDGTEQGTVMVKDITGGPVGTHINRMINVNGILIFSLSNQIWKSDGTEQGTVLLKTFASNIFSQPVPSTAVAFNNKAFFLFHTGSGTQLWATNGDPTETVMVKEFGGGVSEIAVSNGVLYISGAETSTTTGGLWRSDGTTANTTLIQSNMVGNPYNLTDVNGTLFFRGYKPETGSELWTSNGTTAGTSMVKDIRPFNGHSNPRNFVSTGGKLYFLADDGTNGEELWVSDGITTTMVKNIAPTTQTSVPSSPVMLGVNGQLYFTADDKVHGIELWKTDGTEQGTSLLLDIVQGSERSEPRNLTLFNGHIYFSAYDAEFERDLWRTDGTTVGTQLVKEDDEDVGPSNPHDLRVAGSKLYFFAYDNSHGDELWVSNGSAESTTLLKEITSGTESIYVEEMLDIDGTLLFTDAFQIFKSNGTDAGTIELEPGSGYVSYLTKTTNGFYYVKRVNSTSKYKLFKSDGTAGGSVAISPELNKIHTLKEVNGILYFVGDDGTHGEELWKTTGDLSETVMVKDIQPGAANSVPRNFIEYGDALYFEAWTATSGSELWKCEGGTEIGTTMVADINPGVNSGLRGFPFTEYNGILYFQAVTQPAGNELWRSDGTQTGTWSVFDAFGAGAQASPITFVVLNDMLYYIGGDGVNGAALWQSNGSEAGTSVLFNPDETYINNLTVVDRTLYIDLGTSLWISDGTTEGTTKLMDLPSEIEHIFEHKGHLFFVMKNELWKSDGDACNTFAVNNKSEVAVDSYTTPKGVGDKIYFTGISEATGAELFYYDFSTINTPGCVQSVSITDIPQKKFGEENFNLEANASTGMPVVFSSSNPAVATISGNVVTIVGAGEVTFTATQQGDNRYAVASADKTIVIGKAQATLLLTNTSNVYTGSALKPTATTSPAALDGVQVVYKQNGNVVEAINAGIYEVEVSLNNPNYEAEIINGTFTISKSNQSIAFGALENKVVGSDPFDLGATASSQLAVTYSSSNEAVAKIVDGKVRIVGAGTTEIKAMQNGNDNYNAAPAVTQNFTVVKKSQTITFAALVEKIREDIPFTISASSSSNLPVSFTSSNTNVATITGNTVTIVGAGETVITASNAGNVEFNAATSVTQTLVVKLITGAEFNIEKETVVYPNPAKNYVVVTGGYLNTDTAIDITDAKGKPVNETVTIGGFSEGSINVDVSNLKTGVYLLKIKAGNQVAVKRIVKQ